MVPKWPFRRRGWLIPDGRAAAAWLTAQPTALGECLVRPQNTVRKSLGTSLAYLHCRINASATRRQFFHQSHGRVVLLRSDCDTGTIRGDFSCNVNIRHEPRKIFNSAAERSSTAFLRGCWDCRCPSSFSLCSSVAATFNKIAANRRSATKCEMQRSLALEHRRKSHELGSNRRKLETA